MTVSEIIQELTASGDPTIAARSRSFFKTGPGEYGAGDRFLGIRMPTLRERVRKYRRSSTLDDACRLLRNDYHEIRMAAVLLMVALYEQTRSEDDRQLVVDTYLANSQLVNNWDLVDASAYKILGPHLLQRGDRRILRQLAQSDCVWDRRIAVIATLTLIRDRQFDDLLELAEHLLSDTHDLIHKAVGWMLREVGQRDQVRLIAFLDRHHADMPRTMLRYAIEKLPGTQRRHYLEH